MEESEPTLSTEPSSSAMRARALTWVFTRSCQFTTVLAAAGMVLPLRARFTAGITRETSPARGPVPVPAGAAELSQGIATSQESSIAKAMAHGDFLIIILASPRSTTLSIVVTGGPQNCQSL